MSHSLLHANTAFLFAALGTSVVVLAIALLAERLARRAASSSRHAILLAALLAPPVLTATPLVDLVPSPRLVPPGAIDIQLANPTSVQIVEDAEWPCVLALLWLAGALIALLRTLVIASRWRSVASRARIIGHDLFDDRYLLAKSDEIGEPAVIGIVNPRVVLPDSYDLSDDELQAVFAHELAHIARRDNLVALLVQLVSSLFWFDPLHVLARRKLVELRERVCDELVLARGCDARAYVAALARSCESSLAAPAVACMSRHKLQERMESIMTHRTRRSWPLSITRAIAGALVVAAAVGFAAFAPAPRLVAGEAAATGEYDFDVRVMPHSDGRFTLHIRITSPDGDFASVAEVRSAPALRTVSTTQNGRTYKVVVQLAGDAGATATFDVTEGTTLLKTASKSFPAPEMPAASSAPAGETRRVGGGVKAPIVITRVDPVYPAEAKENRISGIVILETRIDEEGNVTDAQVLKGLPYGLDQAAVDAVRQWHFRPATEDGKPVAVMFNLTINFKLD